MEMRLSVGFTCQWRQTEDHKSRKTPNNNRFADDSPAIWTAALLKPLFFFCHGRLVPCLQIFSYRSVCAIMHAVWNAVVKGTADRTISFGFVAMGHTLPAFIAPSCHCREMSVAYLAVSTVPLRLLLFLNTDTGLAICHLFIRWRAASLPSVAISLGKLDETLPVAAWAGLFCISAGILIIGLGRKRLSLRWRWRWRC